MSAGLREIEQVDPLLNPCQCVRRHAPVPEANVIHHGVALCPTAHDILHRLLDEFAVAGAPTPVGARNRFVHTVAVEEWSRG